MPYSPDMARRQDLLRHVGWLRSGLSVACSEDIEELGSRLNEAINQLDDAFPKK